MNGPERQLDAIAEELYAIRPEGFGAARDEAIRRARAEGKKDLAREIGKLRRPTQSAWLVNLLSRNQPAAIDELFGLADDLGRPQSASELQRVTVRRRNLEEDLVRRGRELAEETGVAVSGSMEREVRETLGAGVARAEVAEEVRTGRMVKPASYAGFGTFSAGAVRGPQENAAPSSAAARKTNNAEKAERLPDERDEARRRKIEEAQAIVAKAAKELAAQEHLAATTRERQQELREQVDELEERVRELRTDLTAVGREAVAADRRREQANKAHKAAVEALERAGG